MPFLCANSLPQGLGLDITTNRERVMNAITAYQLTSMMQGVIQRGTATGVKLPVPVAGKTGTTNDAKDVWFIGFTSNVVAGCYMGYDNPRGLGPKAFGGTLCVPVFQAFMQEAVKRYGGTDFKVPPGGHFVKIDRYTGEHLADDASGANVQAEYFRDGQDVVYGAGATVDGGFAMGQDLPVFAPGETSELAPPDQPTAMPQPDTPAPIEGADDKAGFGSVSSGGLY